MASLKHFTRWRHALASRPYLRTQLRWAQSEASGEGMKPFCKKEYDAQQYGGLKSVDKLLATPVRQGVVGRWDWHFWHFLVALIPPGMAYLLVRWARSDMQAKEKQKHEKKVEAELMQTMAMLKGINAVEQEKHRQPEDEGAELKQRLAELEATVKMLTTMQSVPSTTKPVESSTSLAASPPPSTPLLPPSAAVSPSTTANNDVGPASGGAPPLPKLPDNPLDRLLPETDCQYCNDVRQKMWGTFKSTTGYKSAHDKAQEAATAPADSSQRTTAALASKAPAVSAEAGKDDRPEGAAPVTQGGSNVASTDAPAGEVALNATSASQDASLHSTQLPASPQEHGESGASPTATSNSSAEVNATMGTPLPQPPLEQATSAQEQQGGASAVATASAAAASAPTEATGTKLAASHPSGTPPPLPKLPDNPFDRWLPETDCQFCNDTRQRLWGAFKSTTGYKSAYDKEQEAKAAAAALAAASISSGATDKERASSLPPGQPPPLPKLPDNPFDRWLPETDCQFCNDTRQRLWGAFKSTTGYKSAYDKEQEAKPAAEATESSK